MANITLRQSTGNTEPRLSSANVANTALTIAQLDNNFNNLNTDVISRVLKTGDVITGDLTVSGNTITTPKLISNEVYSDSFNLEGSVYEALHRSPNAITAMFIYDVSKDSDGGAWTEKCQHTSWYNEDLCGKWLGAKSSEANARLVGTTNDYYQLTTDGRFYKLNAGSGTTQVYRGNKRSFPKLAAIVAESTTNVATIYDLTEPGRPMWMRFVAIASSDSTLNWWKGGRSAVSISSVNGLLVLGLNGNVGVAFCNFPKDQLYRNIAGSKPVSARNTSENLPNVPYYSAGTISNDINSVAMTVLPDAPIDPVTGLKVPTIAVATNGGVSVIKHNGTVVNSSATGSYTAVNITPAILTFGSSASSTWNYVLNPGALTSSFSSQVVTASTREISRIVAGTQKMSIRQKYSRTNGTLWQQILHNEIAAAQSLVSNISSTYNAGYLIGDIRRCYLSNTITGSVTNSIVDNSYKSATANIIGTLAANTVASNTSLVAYSGFSANNYSQEPYSSDLDFGTGEWNISAWVNIPTTNTNAGVIVSRSYSTGPYITLGLNSANNIYSTAYDGVTTRTVTTTSTYNTATWTKVESNYRSGRLSLVVNGTEVANTTGTPLLTLNNANAVFTIGNSYALDAPFPGSIALVKASATVPTSEQSIFMYEQEKQLFANNAQCILPSSTDVLDLAYDDRTDTWIASQAGFESTWSGLIRTANTPVPTGSFSKVTSTSGIRLSARTTTNPGVDISFANTNFYSYNKLSKNKNVVVFDYDTIGISANTINGNTWLTSVTVTAGTPYIGMKITGTGIANDTTITGINSNTYYISVAATANSASKVSLNQADYTLPINYTALDVYVDGALKIEGSTKDYTRLYDGFKETIRFGTSPGANAWVQIYVAQE